MLFALAILEQRFDVVVVQPRFIAHMSGSDFQGSASGLTVGCQEPRPKRFIEGIPERRASGLAFALQACDDVVIESNGRSYAHDALSLASKASSSWRLAMKPGSAATAIIRVAQAVSPAIGNHYKPVPLQDANQHAGPQCADTLDEGAPP